MGLRKTTEQPQFDLFVPYITDMAFRDQRETMERPFFSLAKRKRVKPISYRSPNGDIFVEVRAVAEEGMATIWDCDVLIWAASIITAMKDRKLNAVERTLHFHPADLLRGIGRHVGGEDYERLRSALNRLQSTAIRTNIRSRGKSKIRSFSWIESWSEVIDSESGQSRGMTLTISDWLYEGIVMDGGVLAIDPDYFRLTGGRERWLYRVARKHAGGNDGRGFTISLPTLFEKSGAEGSYRRFKFELKKVVDQDELPEYHLGWIEDTQGKEPALNMVRRDQLTTDHPAFRRRPLKDKRAALLPTTG